ncbi:hypothetical protein DYB37_001486 [Aphanomyces astaci]|uniref:Uncharacterized protein n=1 Tax=Aphanomyces astaci TaxID=112090 RepID=A0A3L6V7U8_APHAT|nr:hypothetical protein DYB35_002508 [Aphanomyces astaci]RHZ17291.1 hypothetical protein DYB37_001486 [Aphanomyces astaci]RLO04799.1 hypothetical protein DYB28_003068 [Aphanomyces astaci]
MQLSEVSELRSIISLMRLNAGSSPRFHDRQDSEVDRIYNSSPKVASYEMRSSWLDRPSIQMPVQSNPPPPQSQTQHDDVAPSSHEDSSFKAKQPPPLTDHKQRHGTKDALRDAPNGKPKVIVFDSKKASSSSNVGETIQTILMSHLQGGKRPQLYYGHPECYELRLHEANGYPDEDFPALDRSRKIKNFGDNGNHEFCLCERPEACPPPDGSPAALTTLGMDGTTGKDLLPMLKKKHRLPMLDEYILKVTEADKLRLDLPSEIIDLETNLKPLGLQEVTLARTTEDGDAVSKNVRPLPSTFMYNDVKAAMYKEWTVIKTNKYGKRQHRMLGVDSHKVYNSKVGERAMISRTNIKAERPISSITWLRFLPGPCDFQIQYSQPDEETIDYSAATAYECGTHVSMLILSTEIVAKIKYIQEMHKRK